MAKLDFQTLEKGFHLKIVEPKNSIYSTNVTTLLDVRNMQTFLAHYALQIGALEPAAAAAYFIRCMGGVLLAQQYFMSLYNTTVDFSLSNLKVYVIDRAHVVFQPLIWREEPGPQDEEERNRWVLQMLSNMYGDVAWPLIQCLSAMSYMSIEELWGQLPIAFLYRLETISRTTSRSEYRGRLEKDFSFLKQELPPSVFHLSANPFNYHVQLIPHIENPDLKERVKPACCMYHRTESGFYCYTCPRLNDEDREIRRQLHKAKRNVGK